MVKKEITNRAVMFIVVREGGREGREGGGGGGSERVREREGGEGVCGLVMEWSGVEWSENREEGIIAVLKGLIQCLDVLDMFTCSSHQQPGVCDNDDRVWCQ